MSRPVAGREWTGLLTGSQAYRGQWSVSEIAWRVLAVIGVPSLRFASLTYRCGYAFVSGPCEEHRCRRHTTPPLHRQTTNLAP